MDFADFLYRIKQELDLKQDKDVADFLNLEIKAFSARKTRNSVPVDKLRAAALAHPELNIDVEYILTGQRKNAVTKEPARQPELTLSAEEQTWLEVFRQLAPAARQSVLDFAKYQLSEQEKKVFAEDNQIQRHYGT